MKVAIANVDKESLERATTHGETISFPSLMIDVSLAKEVQAEVERVAEEYSGLDTVVNCTGIE